MNKRLPAFLIAITATAFLTGCGSDDTDPAPTTAAAPQPASSEAPSSAQTATVTEASASNPEAIAPGEPAPGRSPEESLPGEPEAGSCLDVNSQVVGAAFSSLSPSPGGDGWIAGQSSESPDGNCGDLEYVLAETPGGTASSPTQVLFFHDNTYLGTATSDAYAYTTVAGTNGNSVSVNYKWLAPQDANCCPSGGPATITYTWDGSGVVMDQPLPQEMLDSYGR